MYGTAKVSGHMVVSVNLISQRPRGPEAELMMTFTFTGRAGIAEMDLTRIALLALKLKGKMGYSLPILRISLEQPTSGPL